jgi:hypothetical protein
MHVALDLDLDQSSGFAPALVLVVSCISPCVDARLNPIAYCVLLLLLLLVVL